MVVTKVPYLTAISEKGISCFCCLFFLLFFPNDYNMAYNTHNTYFTHSTNDICCTYTILKMLTVLTIPTLITMLTIFTILKVQ